MGKGGGTKHAKNQCTQAHYSQAERKADGYGSQKQRLGGESLLPFGTCCISLKPVVDPVVSKKGDLFSRDAIVEYLAYQKVAQQREKAAYAQQEAGKAAEAAAAEAAAAAAAGTAARPTARPSEVAAVSVVSTLLYAASQLPQWLG